MKFLRKFDASHNMKRFLVILLCFSSCLFFGPEAVNAAPHVASPAYSGNMQPAAGAEGTEAMKTGKLSGPENDTRVHHAAPTQESSSAQGFMDPELLALLLLIMVLGMLYTNPSR